MENESVNVVVCSLCFHNHSQKCDHFVIDGLSCDCPLGIPDAITETYQILEQLNTWAKNTLIRLKYIECELQSEEVKIGIQCASRVYALSSLFNSLVTPDLGDDHSPRTKNHL